jgi:hypothetical protein
MATRTTGLRPSRPYWTGARALGYHCEWGWYRSLGAARRGECCGIVGGSRVDFLQHFAGQALRLLLEPANRSGLAALPDPAFLTVTLEQYLLAACLEHHRNRCGSPYRDVAISYLFRSWAEAAEPARGRAGLHPSDRRYEAQPGRRRKAGTPDEAGLSQAVRALP